MIGKACFVAAAVSVAVGLSGQPARSEPTGGVRAGILTCNVDSGWGLVFTSARDLRCTYTDNDGTAEQYTGHIDRFGLDLGYHAGGVVAWAVLAPTTNIADGALAGGYGGVTGGLAFGVGAGANLLVGSDSGRTISLQPLSLEGMTGVNLAAGIAHLVLTRSNA